MLHSNLPKSTFYANYFFGDSKQRVNLLLSFVSLHGLLQHVTMNQTITVFYVIKFSDSIQCSTV